MHLLMGPQLTRCARLHPQSAHGKTVAPSSEYDECSPHPFCNYYSKMATWHCLEFHDFSFPLSSPRRSLRTRGFNSRVRHHSCTIQSGPDSLPSDCDAQSGVGSRELLLDLVTQVCALTPRTSRRLQPFPSARRLVADRAPLTPANFRSSLAGLPPPLA